MSSGHPVGRWNAAPPHTSPGPGTLLGPCRLSSGSCRAPEYSQVESNQRVMGAELRLRAWGSLGSVLPEGSGNTAKGPSEGSPSGSGASPTTERGSGCASWEEFSRRRPWLLGLASGSAHLQGLSFLEF